MLHIGGEILVRLLQLLLGLHGTKKLRQRRELCQFLLRFLLGGGCPRKHRRRFALRNRFGNRFLASRLQRLHRLRRRLRYRLRYGRLYHGSRRGGRRHFHRSCHRAGHAALRPFPFHLGPDSPPDLLEHGIVAELSKQLRQKLFRHAGRRRRCLLHRSSRGLRRRCFRSSFFLNRNSCLCQGRFFLNRNHRP